MRMHPWVVLLKEKRKRMHDYAKSLYEGGGGTKKTQKKDVVIAKTVWRLLLSCFALVPSGPLSFS